MAINKAEARPCLYCTARADSPQHFVPSAIGGVLRPLIVCGYHNNLVSTKCEAPLIAQLKYLVHALNVVKARGKSGASVEMTDETGETFTVSSSHRPEPKQKILERDADGKPTKFLVASLDQAKKLLASMGRSLDDPAVTFEHKTEAAPPLRTSLILGGEPGFRGILKIAYEFVRGHQTATIADTSHDVAIRRALLESADPSEFVRWLPFDLLPQFNQAPYYSHRLMAWQDGSEVLVVVELFNVYPFVVRLPGLNLVEPIVYNQGISGENPALERPLQAIMWRWRDVPLQAQSLMFAEIKARLDTVMLSMTLGDMIGAFSRCLDETVETASPQDDAAMLVDQAIRKAARLMPKAKEYFENLRPLAIEAVKDARRSA